MQISPSPKPHTSLPPLPLYDQPPSSPYPSPDKRSSQFFPRSPSANGKSSGHLPLTTSIYTSIFTVQSSTSWILFFRKQPSCWITRILTSLKTDSWHLIWQASACKSPILKGYRLHSSSKLKMINSFFLHRPFCYWSTMQCVGESKRTVKKKGYTFGCEPSL